jgi:hypothetical protein
MQNVRPLVTILARQITGIQANPGASLVYP